MKWDHLPREKTTSTQRTTISRCLEPSLTTLYHKDLLSKAHLKCPFSWLIFFFLAGACGGTYTELVSGHGLRARDTKTNRKHSLFCPKMGKKAIHGQITVQQRKCLESNKTKWARVKTRTYIYALDISIVLSPCFHYTSLFVFGAISTLNWEFLHSLKNTHFSSIMCLALCWADQTLLSEFWFKCNPCCHECKVSSSPTNI